MSIPLIITEGYGNGTLTGSIADVVRRGFSSGAAPTWLPAWRRQTGYVIGCGEKMYPKNAASPQRVAIGPVVQISDGAVQTSGVSVSVMPQGGAAGAGGGTIAYEQGIVHYIPTQAETNYASFVLIAYKTGCIPATCTVVTSASATAGYAGLDWSVINAPTTTVNLSGTTIKTATDVETDTNELQTDWANGGRLDLILDARASQTSVDTIDDFLDTEIAALTTELAKVPKSDGTATWNATALASIQAEATDALNAYDPPTNAELTAALAAADDAVLAAIAALNNLSAAQVNAEVVDALNVDTYAEISSIPAATTTITNMIRLLYSMTRNKTTQTATTFLLRNDADSATIGTATVSDDGTTAIKGELA